MGYQNMNFGSDFVHPSQIIPSARQSAEEEYPLKTSALPSYEPFKASSVYNFPLKVPTHQFIYKDLSFARYKPYDS